MSLATLEGTVAFENLNEHEMYQGQSTGKFSLVVSLDDATADELDAKGNQKYNKLYDSVFDTSLELIRMMRDFNLTGDTQMTAIADQLENALYSVNTDALKSSDALRTNKAAEVTAILATLPSLDM